MNLGPSALKPKENPRRRVGPWLLVTAGAMVLILGFLTPTDKQPPSGTGGTAAGGDSWRLTLSRLPAVRPGHSARTAPTATEIVARRLKLFSSKQRALVHRLAEHYHLDVPSDVDRFFDALDAGDWEEAKRIFKSLRGDSDGAPRDESLRKFWRSILEAYGAAEQAQLWPAQQFLDYGNGILNSLRPGMVYVGGTDPGCFICTMLNATAEGEQHQTLTQNALADGSYLEYLRASGDGTLNIPTDEDSQAAFSQYTQDATNRLAHDQQFPDEPKQLLPGEDITMKDGKVQIAGVTAVMAINNILTQDLLRENPGVSFAMEESYPMSSTYAGAAPLGPIFELNAATDGQNAISSDAANQVVGYWRDLSQTLQANPDASSSWATLISYAHDAAAQGNLLADNDYPAQAEQAYQTALSISPDCLDAIKGLTQLLAAQNRYADAAQALDSYLQNNPSQSQTIATIRQSYVGNKAGAP
ncbi:MAG: tetratricopeptide repeat protein [Verrucomicrobiota bacterium]|jgi:tetratricopeptide (TPR) repeat protein